MTNYNERLDEILDNVLIGMYCTNPDGDFVPLYDGKNVLRDGAKQALTSLIKELVAEAKPSYKTDTRGATQNPNNAFYHTKKAQGYNEAIEDYEQNLLKALEEV